MKKNYNLLYLAVIMLSTFTMSYAQIISDGTYKIYSTVHNEVMTCATTTPYDANMATPNATDTYQLWTFTHQGGDVYKIVNQGNGLTLGINDGWCGQFGDVKANFGNTDTNVEFKVTNSTTAGKYVFEIAFTTCNFGSVNSPIKAFDIQDGNSGAQIQTYDIDYSNSNQQFEIIDPATLSNSSFTSVEKYTAYYNPNTGLLITSIDPSLTNLNVSIYDLTGKTVKTQSYNLNNSNSIQLNVSDLSKGIYAVHILVDNNIKRIQKIIIY